jgi:hypothetical protein
MNSVESVENVLDYMAEYLEGVEFVDGHAHWNEKFTEMLKEIIAFNRLGKGYMHYDGPSISYIPGKRVTMSEEQQKLNDEVWSSGWGKL